MYIKEWSRVASVLLEYFARIANSFAVLEYIVCLRVSSVDTSQIELFSSESPRHRSS